MWVAGFSLFLLGIVLVIAGPVGRRKNSRCSAQTQGMLREIFETDSSGGGVGHAYVYSYSVGGTDYEITSTAYNAQVDKVGDTCTIWYNPKRPQDAQEFHYGSARVYSIILAAGIVLVLLGIVLTMAGVAQQ